MILVAPGQPHIHAFSNAYSAMIFFFKIPDPWKEFVFKIMQIMFFKS